MNAAGRGRFLLAAGLSGSAVMLIELTATRALAPVFGASLFVWTNVIGVVLLALTMGYVTGGRLADRRPEPALLGGILLVAGLLSLPAPFLAVTVGEWLLPEPEALSALTGTGHVVRGSLAVSLLLFAPPIFLMGMVGPFVTRCLIDTGLEGGTAAGRTLGASTFGSIVGTYLPAHVLIEQVGSRGSLLCGSGLLLAASLTLLARRRAAAGVLLAIVLAGVPLQTGLPVRGPVGGGGDLREVAVLCEMETAYQYVRVARWEGSGPEFERRLSLDEGVLEFHSLSRYRRLDAGGERLLPLTGGMYYDAFALLPELVRGAANDPADVLVLGGGAGTMGRMLRDLQAPRVARIVSVELDPAVASLHEQFGWRPGPRDHLLAGDARVVLRSLSERFDVVILDAYARQIAIPPHLATVEFFQSIADHLTPRGILALNVSVPDVEGPLMQSLRRTLEEVFPRLHAVALPGVWNVVLLASGGELPRIEPERGSAVLRNARRDWNAGLQPLPPVRKDLPVLTDDRAPLEHLARRS